MNSIDLYLISGFLGAGKTTFLKNTLTKDLQKKVGCIINEFGSISVDGKLLKREGLEIVEINNGSIFCSCLKESFVDALLECLTYPIDALFVEASGMADPSGIADLVGVLEKAAALRSGITRRYEFKGSICVVDAVEFLDFCDVFISLRNQIAKSGIVIVNKIDLTHPDELAEIRNAIRELNPVAQVYETQYCDIPANLFDLSINNEPSMSGDTSNTCDNRPASYVLRLPDAYDPEHMQIFLNALSGVAVRVKGFFADEKNTHYYADAVKNVLKITPAACEFEADERSLVVIGRDTALFEDVIRAAWQSCFPDRALECIFDS
jgi:G3E family GTPase